MITYKVQRVTEPAAEPVSLATAKDHLKLEADFNLEDDLIAAYISAARDEAEKYCNRSFALADFFLLLDALPRGRKPLHLPDPLTAEVNGITYLDESGTEQTLDPAGYTFDADRQHVRPAEAWPTYARSVKVSYSAGPDASASPPQVPPKSVVQAMLLLLTDMYEVRQAQVVGNMINANPAAAMRLSLHRVEMGV